MDDTAAYQLELPNLRAVVYGPPLTTQCAALDGPAAARITMSTGQRCVEILNRRAIRRPATCRTRGFTNGRCLVGVSRAQHRHSGRVATLTSALPPARATEWSATVQQIAGPQCQPQLGDVRGVGQLCTREFLDLVDAIKHGLAVHVHRRRSALP